MTRLESIPAGELEAALDEVAGNREAKRLLTAIIYKRGPSVPMIAEWLDVREQTIYRWFDRLEAEPVEQAVTDRQRSGRPAKLDEAARKEFQVAIRGAPTDVGYDRSTWTTELARRFLEDEFGVEYTRRHVRRLLKRRTGSGDAGRANAETMESE